MTAGLMHRSQQGFALRLFLPFLLLSLPSRAETVVFQSNGPPVQLQRYLVFTEAAAAQSVANGARVVRETRGLKAIVCSTTLAASLGLMEDIPVHAMDSTANTQILASVAQEMGLAGRGRKIVVLDSGYNYNHPELRSSYLGGKDFVNDDDDPMDDNGHGSHVAGIITGDGVDPRARGVAPETGIIAGKVLDAYGNGYISDITAGIYWAVDGPDGVYGSPDDFRADAINISIGTTGGYLFPSRFCDAVMPLLTEAIQYAVERGVLVVIAAGNNDVSGVALPGCVSFALTVGAVDTNDVLAGFSGIGPAVDLVAPGRGLYSASKNGLYASLDGTSQAAAVVSGAVALLREAFPNSSLNDIQNALLTGATDLGTAGEDNRYGWGRVDVPQALSVLTAGSPGVPMSVVRSNSQVVISWPLIPPGFRVQANSRFERGTNGWHTLTNVVTTIGNQNTMVLPLLVTNQVYRLLWQ